MCLLSSNNQSGISIEFVNLVGQKEYFSCFSQEEIMIRLSEIIILEYIVVNGS